MAASSMMPEPPATPPRTGFWLVNYIRAHPLLLLLLLTPGIPEYLSSSSSLAFLVLNPPLFFLFLGLNIGLYFTGVVLIREAVIRWGKGWSSVFILGFAYSIVEEGLALRTFYNPNAGPVGVLGVYGHWAGVNWVWTIGLMLFHSAISIAVPIFLFGLAFPSLKRKSLASIKRQAFYALIMTIDCAILAAAVNYDPGGLIILSSGMAVVLLIFAARRAPNMTGWALSAEPKRKPLTFGLFGALFFPSVILVGWFAAGVNVSPIVPIVADIAISALLLNTILRNIGTLQNQAHKTALAIGLVTPIVVFGFIASLSTLPVVLLADVSFAVFSRRLWKRYHGMIRTLQLPAPMAPSGWGQSSL